MSKASSIKLSLGFLKVHFEFANMHCDSLRGSFIYYFSQSKQYNMVIGLQQI
jgi:hypothetical protein